MQTLPEPRLTLPVTERDHIRGPADAAVTLVEYGDYQCPYCGAAYLVVEDLRRAIGDGLRFVYRNFPLTQIHDYAQVAAEAAEATAVQGKFWEMHEMLYTHQSSLDASHVVKYAAKIGADPEPIRRALEEGAFRDRVRDDFLGGVRSGVNGTPTFFIQGARFDGPPVYDALFAALRSAAAHVG